MDRNINIPKILYKCPIVQAIAEMRFDSTINPDNLLSIIYPHLINDFPVLKSLEIPQIFGDDEDNKYHREYHPLYQLENDNFFLRIGPKLISFVVLGEYIGWEKYFNLVSKYFKVLADLKLFENFTRVGVRYLNYFKDNIFTNSMIDLSKNNKSLSNNKIMIKMNDVAETTVNNQPKKIISKMEIYNKTEIIINKETLFGSMIDIDTSVKSDLQLNDVLSTLNKCHNEEKNVFFSLLTDKYIEELTRGNE